jgi:urea transport system permease protein
MHPGRLSTDGFQMNHSESLGPRRPVVFCSLVVATTLSLVLAAPADAAIADLAPLLPDLGAAEIEAVAKAVQALGDKGDPAALPALEALYEDNLRVGPDGRLYIKDAKKGTLVDVLSGAVVSPEPAALRAGEMNNEIRRVILPIIAQLKLSAPDPAMRLAAADELAKSTDGRAVTQLRRARARETDPAVKDALSLALARVDLQDPNPETRLAALTLLDRLGKRSVKGDLEALVRKKPDGAFTEPDDRVRRAAAQALSAIETREMIVSGVGHLLYGLSLASVFLFAALGLAITFGVMGVINMAHGEMLTIGAYTTYAVQVSFQKNLPGAYGLYLVAAIPIAFMVATTAGVLLERTVIRWLYGRPLETMLATWGISLVVIQTVRLIFGAANVAVENPTWLAGGTELADGLVLPYNRIGVVCFVILAALFVYLLLNRTSLGLQVRAVVQNRNMAACMGVRTSRVDMWTFGLGSGIAGLGGVALSQLGNVGPELGQAYIIDSFMVVVLGGVGRIAGTLGAAFGLGIINKLLEPISGAVLGKIAVLVLIILFIQWRPQGIFPQKGRIEA